MTTIFDKWLNSRRSKGDIVLGPTELQIAYDAWLEQATRAAELGKAIPLSRYWPGSFAAVDGARQAIDGWNWDGMRAALDADTFEDVDTDDGPVRERRIWLGTYAITPSGKVYTPFASSNLRPCAHCDGHGWEPLAGPLLEYAQSVMAKKPSTPFRADGSVSDEWNEHLVKANPLTLNAIYLHGGDTWGIMCLHCGGTGYPEATADDVWRTVMEEMADLIPPTVVDGETSSVFFSEDDGDYFIVERIDTGE